MSVSARFFPSGMQMVTANPLIVITVGHRPICAGDYVEHFDPDLVSGATLNGSGMGLGFSRRNLPLCAGQGVGGGVRGAGAGALAETCGLGFGSVALWVSGYLAL